MKLLPIKESQAENPKFAQNPDCEPTLDMTINYYNRIGYQPPWIGYYAEVNGQVVGSAGFKGKPVDGKIEIAYGTFPSFQKQGIGTEICRQLVAIAQQTDPTVRITARTLPEPNYSTRILQKNGFTLVGTVQDPEDGDVWEWELLSKNPA